MNVFGDTQTHTQTDTQTLTHTHTHTHKTLFTISLYSIQFNQCLQAFFLSIFFRLFQSSQQHSLFLSIFCVKFRIVFSLFSCTLLTISINLLFFSTKQINTAENSFIHYERNKLQFIQNEARHALGPLV